METLNYPIFQGSLVCKQGHLQTFSPSGIPAQKGRVGDGKKAGQQGNRCLNTVQVRVEAQDILELRSTYILT